jgi:hypothetical protein
MDERDDTRITAVEEKLAYLEHNLQELDEVVREVADSVQQLRQELARLRAERPREQEPAGQGPDAAPLSREEQLTWDKPPHW